MSVSLVDALTRLRDQGYEIFYSNDLVTSSQRINISVVDIENVRAALPQLGLSLTRSGDSWLVVSDLSAASVLDLQIVSASGDPIDDVEFRMVGEKAQRVTRAANSIFAVKLPAGPRKAVTIRAENHYPRTIRLAGPGEVIVLQPLGRIENVIVTGSRHVVASGVGMDSSTTLSAEEMDAAPALAGDAMRVTARLPGIASVGISAKPFVRGGVEDETLTLLDGIELLDPYHLADFQSIFSSVDARLVDEINVYTGGFPARYGNRMSGVLDISTLESDVAAHTEVGVSVLSSFVNTRGLSDDQRTDWVASARHGNLDLLTNWLDPQWGNPKFDDAYLRVGRRLGEGVKVLAGVMMSHDNISITDQSEIAGSDIDTTYWWTRLDATHTESLHSSTSLTYVTSDREKTETNLERDAAQGFLKYNQAMKEYVLRSDFTYSKDARLIEFGATAEYGESRYDSRALIDRGAIGVLLGGSRVDAFDIHTDPSGWSGSAYWSGEFWVFNRIALQPGVRWDFQNYVNGCPSQVSPRFSVRWNTTDRTTLRLSTGRYYQPERIHEMKVTDGVDHFLSPQQSDHVVGSLEWDPRPGVRIGIEVYSKDYEATSIRFENLFNRFVLLPEIEPDRVAISSNRARVRGADIETRFDITDQVSGALAYSYLDADDRIGGSWEPRAWSQRHTLQGMLIWRTEPSSVAVGVTWHSGWRTTRLPNSFPVGTQIPLAAIYNNGTLSDYASFDLSASYSWHFGRASITAQADVTNAFNRSNHGGVDYSAVETAGEVELFRTDEALLPWVPTVGIVIAF